MFIAIARRSARATPALIALCFSAATTTAAFAGSDDGPPTALFVDPSSTTMKAAATLQGRDQAVAQRLASFPSATWFTQGTPAAVQAAAKDMVDRAVAKHAIPTLVAYNLPYRDCSQYSSGGAANIAEYKAWIDGLAAGIGQRKAIVIVEPDGLGIIPFHTDLAGKAEWCKPTGANPSSAASDRYAALNYAVDKLTANPNAQVYLDGTHSAWLGVGDISNRLVKAGVLRANGFFVNVSNYEPTSKLQHFGGWISQCIYYANNSAEGGKRLGRYAACASQYSPATVSDESTWALSDKWYADNVAAAPNPPSGPAALKHFVMDTSRNGQGAWSAPAGTNHPDAQTWCNPPNRGLGIPPSLQSGQPLIDAVLWIKVPGESDGQCDRGTGSAIDPARGYADPAAGAWFTQQAQELLTLSNPAIAPK